MAQTKINGFNALNALGEGVALIDKSHNIFWVNRSFEQLLGNTSENFIGKKCYKVLHGRNSPKPSCPMDQALKTGLIKISELSEPHMGSSVFELKASPVLDHTNRVDYVILTIKDISELKKDRKTLEENTFWLKESQRVAQLGSYVLNIETGLWTSSPVLDELFGISQDYRRDVKGWLDIVHPSQRDEMKAYFTIDVLKNHGFFDKDYRVIRKKDNEVRWVHGLGELVFDENNHPVKMIGTIQDVTDSKIAENALKESEQRFHSLVENIPDVTWITDNEGKTNFISSNIKDIYGYTPEEIYKEGEDLWFGRIHPDDVSKVKKTYQSLFTKKGNFNIEYRIKRKDGNWIWLYDRGMTTFEKKGVKYAYGVFSDITKRKRSEDELKSAYKELKTLDELKTDLIANVSHELRTPITIASSALELALSEDDPSERTSLLNIASEALIRQNMIVEDLIEASSLDRKKRNLNLKPLDMALLVDSVCKELSSMGKKNQVTLSNGLEDEDFPNVNGDYIKIMHVLRNLIGNAIKFSKKDGEIIIDGSLSGDLMKISVTDTGVGIPLKHQGKVFDRFYQVDSSAHRSFAGTGLGLAIVKEIIEAHGGGVSVKSAPGKGSSFCFTIPLLERVL